MCILTIIPKKKYKYASLVLCVVSTLLCYYSANCGPTEEPNSV